MITVGNNLHSRVELARAEDMFSTLGPKLVPDFDNPDEVYCDIRPIKALKILNGVNETYDEPTHKITMRWRNDLHEFTHLKRSRERRDGTSYAELFLLHGYTELEGKQRWIEVEAEFVRYIEG